MDRLAFLRAKAARISSLIRLRRLSWSQATARFSAASTAANPVFSRHSNGVTLAGASEAIAPHETSRNANQCGASRTAEYARRQRLRQSLRNAQRLALVSAVASLLIGQVATDFILAIACFALAICIARIVFLWRASEF